MEDVICIMISVWRSCAGFVYMLFNSAWRYSQISTSHYRLPSVARPTNSVVSPFRAAELCNFSAMYLV